MKQLHTFVLALLFSLVGQAQTGWTLIPSGTTQDLHAIDYNFMVGDSGMFLKSPDIGLTWAALNSGTTKDLYDIVGCGSGCLYFCGDSGTVVRAIANGTIIEQHDIPGRDLPLWDIAIQGSDQPLVVGDSGYFARSFNFGTLFTEYPTGTEEHVYGLSGFGLTYRLAVGANGTVLKSDDLGLTWASVLSGTTSDLYDIYAQQSFAAIAVGNDGTILRSEVATNGLVWSTINGPVTTRLNAVARDGLGGAIMAVGDGGVIIRSQDDGLTWTQLVSNTTEDLYDVFPWSGAAWLVAGANGTILRSTNNGGSGVGVSELNGPLSMFTVRSYDAALFVNFETSEPLVFSLHVMDASGRDVLAPQQLGKGSGAQQIRVPFAVATGVYTVQLRAGQQQFSRRVGHLSQ